MSRSKQTAQSVLYSRVYTGAGFLVHCFRRIRLFSQCIPPDHERGRILFAVVGSVSINLHAVCQLTCSNDFKDEQRVLKLMVWYGPPMYHVPGIVICTTVGLVYRVAQKKLAVDFSSQ